MSRGSPAEAYHPPEGSLPIFIRLFQWQGKLATEHKRPFSRSLPVGNGRYSPRAPAKVVGRTKKQSCGVWCGKTVVAKAVGPSVSEGLQTVPGCLAHFQQSRELLCNINLKYCQCTTSF